MGSREEDIREGESTTCPGAGLSVSKVCIPVLCKGGPPTTGTEAVRLLWADDKAHGGGRYILGKV